MKKYNPSFIDREYYKNNKREPNFDNFLKVLKKEKPDRPTLFEFFLNDIAYRFLADDSKYKKEDAFAYQKLTIDAFKNAGYDYVTIHGSGFYFKTNRVSHEGAKSISLNEGYCISDRESYDKYIWIEPSAYTTEWFEAVSKFLPEGMKIMLPGPSGVLENTIAVTGYDNLCYMSMDDPELTQEIFDQVGKRIYEYYSMFIDHPAVGVMMINDDWGFNTQTMLSVEQMRKYVFPWHKKLVQLANKAGKPTILHSCGNLAEVMDDIIYDIKYDGKHSYEDAIMPVEKAYEKYAGKIAILGGIDVDFICRRTPEEVYERSAAMLELASGKGGYAMGSGNSIPYYVPEEGYLAMIASVNFNEK